jgi:hypothetical protein
VASKRKLDRRPRACRLGSRLPAQLARAHPILDRWALDSNFWLRRSAMLALLGPLRAGGGEFERFAGHALAMLPMTREEPAVARKFIDKTIGWILREVGRKRPALVRGSSTPTSTSCPG